MGACSTRIVKDGDAVGLWKNGRLTIYRGPAKVRRGMGGEFQVLTTSTANEHQYIVVEYLDGHTEHLQGPTSVLYDPTQHKRLTVATAKRIDAGNLIVVLRRKDKHPSTTTATTTTTTTTTTASSSSSLVTGDTASENVERIIVRGPCYHIPTPDETIHQFVWHGSDTKNPAKKIPRQLQFEELRTIPDQMYLSVPEVRTSDDALLTVNTMIFYELDDVVLMLNRSHDPIADFVNAATADIVSFAAVLSYEMFLEKTDMLNSLETYTQLTSRAKGIGFSITKVVYRGYTATNKLQLMHDDAIQARTQLRLEAETEEQAQRLADLKLAKEYERQRKKQEMQRQEVEHNNQLSRMQHEERVAQDRAIRESEIASEHASNEERLGFYRSLKEAGVNLTEYLTSQTQRADKLIQISSDPSSRVHVHANN